MVILYLRPSGRAPRNYPGWCRLAHQPGSLAHRLGVWGDKGSWHLWEGTETEKKHTHECEYTDRAITFGTASSLLSQNGPLSLLKSKNVIYRLCFSEEIQK